VAREPQLTPAHGLDQGADRRVRGGPPGRDPAGHRCRTHVLCRL